MKKWMLLPGVLFLAATLAAQTSSPVPAGTALMVRLDTTLATFSNKAGDPFQGKITPAGSGQRQYRDSQSAQRLKAASPR